MEITLFYFDWLGLYATLDFKYVYDPSTNQLYQSVAFGQYQPVYPEQTDPYSGGPFFPAPQFPAPQPAPQAPAPPPVYVQPPRVGVVSYQGQTNPAPPAYQPQVSRPAPVVAPAAPPSTQPSGGTQYAPPPRPGPPLAQPRPVGSGGSVRMRNDPDPKQGYWEALQMIGYWVDVADAKDYYQASYPVNKVRLGDGRPWPYGKLAIYEGRNEKQGVYIMLYDSPDREWAHKSYQEKIRAVLVKPVWPF